MTRCACRRHALCMDCMELARIRRRAVDLGDTLALRLKHDLLHSWRVDAPVAPLRLLPPWPPERRETAGAAPPASSTVSVRVPRRPPNSTACTASFTRGSLSFGSRGTSSSARAHGLSGPGAYSYRLVDEGRASGLCPRCGRTYCLEPAHDPGVCCICHRDDVMVGMLGPSWRALLSASRGSLRERETDSPVTVGALPPGDPQAVVELGSSRSLSDPLSPSPLVPKPSSAVGLMDGSAVAARPTSGEPSCAAPPSLHPPAGAAQLSLLVAA